MPRQRRPWAPGDLLSIVGRGHEGRLLFASPESQAFFTDRVRRVFVPDAVDLHAWALLDNHYHMLLRVTNWAPERLFRRLNTALGMRERRLCGDQGTVFQGRYWSGRCIGEGSVLSVLTYVLGNPIHHDAVASVEALESYPRTAYPELLGRAAPGLVNVAKTLALVDPDPGTARAILRDAVAARVARWRAERPGVDPCDEPGCRGADDGCLLLHRRARTRDSAGAPTPSVAASVTEGVTRVHDERFERQLRLRSQGWCASDLIASVCAHLGVDASELSRGRRHSEESAARAVIVHVACDGLGLPAIQLAPMLGVSGAAVGAARSRGRDVMAVRGWSVDDVLTWTRSC